MYSIRNTKDITLNYNKDNINKFKYYRDKYNNFNKAITKKENKNISIVGIVYGNEFDFNLICGNSDMNLNAEVVVVYSDNTFIILTDKYLINGKSNKLKEYVSKYGYIV